MGRMTHSSTLLVPHPWSHHVALGSITWYLLGCKPCFLAHIGTQSYMLPPTTWPATFTLKHQGNCCPCANRTYGYCCSMGNKRWKTASSVLPEAAPLNCAPWRLCRKSGPRTPTANWFGSPVLAALLNYLPGAQARKAGPRTPAVQRLGSLVPSAVTITPGSPAPTSKPLG
jgi:hypothetical protein